MFSLPAHLGIVRLLVGPLGLRDDVPPDVVKAFPALLMTLRCLRMVLDEGAVMAESLRQAGTVSTLGYLPLIILLPRLDQYQDWQVKQTELLQLSSNSQQLIVDKSGHNIEVDQPGQRNSKAVPS